MVIIKENPSDEIIQLNEIEVQIKAYLWECDQAKKGHNFDIGYNPFELDGDELKTLIRSARTHQVRVSNFQDTIMQGMEEWVLCDAVGIKLNTYEFRGDNIALQLLELIKDIKEKVAQ